MQNEPNGKRTNINGRPVKICGLVGGGGGGGGGGGLEHPKIFAKVDLLPIDNDKEKKKVAKNKPIDIPRKLLVTLLWFTSCNL